MAKDIKVLAFSRNLAYNLGGAERSLFSQLEKERYSNIDVLYVEQPAISKFKFDFVSDKKFKKIPIFDAKLNSRFFYLEYFRNRKLIDTYVSKLDFDLLVAQNRWAPAAILSSAKKGSACDFYLRDETSLGIVANYYHGAKRLLKEAYKLAESPWIVPYRMETYLALKSASRVVANSNFIAERLWGLHKIESDVIYPYIDVVKLKKSYGNFLKHKEKTNRAIVMVGDSRIKGVDTFVELAELFPEEQFFVYGKNKRNLGARNVTHMGWLNDPADAYSNAKVIIVPSVWEEAFGRVAVEAKLLGIPVIVSERGGLPEAVSYDQDSIAVDFQDFRKKLARIL